MNEQTRKRIGKRWWFILGCALILCVLFSNRGGGRVVMERAFNRRGCLIGTAPDGRIAMVADGNLVLVDSNHVETTVAKLKADGFQGTPIGTNGFILVDSVFGAGSSVFMFDWTGRELWTYSIPSRSVQIGVSQEGTIYALNETNVLYALNLDGTPRWTNSVFSFRNFFYRVPVIDLDGRVAIFGNDRSVTVLDRNGNELWGDVLWPRSGVDSYASFASNGFLVIASGTELRCYDKKGIVSWGHDYKSEIEAAPAFGANDMIYCLARDRVIALDSAGNQLWQRNVASYTPNTWKQYFGRDWATFSRAGELVTVAADYELLQYSAKQTSGMRLVTLAVNERLICLRKDGSVSWEQPIPSSIDWKIPTSRWDWKVLWKSRMGLHNAKYFRSMTTASDGTIYGLGLHNSETRILGIRSD